MKFYVYRKGAQAVPWKRQQGLTWKVYLLIDPRDSTVRYVGVTRDPEQRLASHKSPAATNWGMLEWKLSMRRDGVEPHMLVVDSAPHGSHLKLENDWMMFFVDQGYWLLNSAPNAEWKLVGSKPMRVERVKKERKPKRHRSRARRLAEWQKRQPRQPYPEIPTTTGAWMKI